MQVFNQRTNICRISIFKKMVETRCTGGFRDGESHGANRFKFYGLLTLTGPPVKIGTFWRILESYLQRQRNMFYRLLNIFLSPFRQKKVFKTFLNKKLLQTFLPNFLPHFLPHYHTCLLLSTTPLCVLRSYLFGYIWFGNIHWKHQHRLS